MSPRLDCRARASNTQGHDVGLHPARDITVTHGYCACCRRLELRLKRGVIEETPIDVESSGQPSP
eukprot:scaffold49611_cov66-Phaeocystis_antarctica.AAC.3